VNPELVETPFAVSSVSILPCSAADKPMVAALVIQSWGTEVAVAHGAIYRPADLPASSPRWMGSWSA